MGRNCPEVRIPNGSYHHLLFQSQEYFDPQEFDPLGDLQALPYPWMKDMVESQVFTEYQKRIDARPPYQPLVLSKEKLLTAQPVAQPAKQAA